MATRWRCWVRRTKAEVTARSGEAERCHPGALTNEGKRARGVVALGSFS